MTQYSPPSYNPNYRYSLAGLLTFALQKELQNMDGMLPAVVLSYDRSTNMATVQPAINIIASNNTVVPQSPVTVPALQLGAGGFVISIPINAGDKGWLKANDRDISIWLQNSVIAAPASFRQHSFADGMFIPDTMLKGVTIDSDDTNNLVIQNNAGTVKISLSSDTVIIKAPNIVFDSPITTITGELVAGTNSSYNQTASFSGNITTTGEITSTKGGTHTLTEHTHGGVQNGSGNTSTPTG